jgi:tetrapyrrole methylase family protein/MazG family protein
MKMKKSCGRGSRSPARRKGSILEQVPKGLPILSIAYQVTEKASRLGFDWPNLKGVLKKLDEELKEFRKALLLRNRGRIREEIGDLLFVLVNISRFLRIHPEEALRKTVKKFISRFDYIETSLRKQGKSFYQVSLTEMDRLWEEAKRKRFRR